MSRVGVGIIGAGFGASVQLPGFLRIPDAEVIGIVSTNSGTSETLAKAYGLPRAFGSWQEMLACDDIDLVSIATPPLPHAVIAHAALAARKHVLCEKPFTRSAADARALLDAAEHAGVVHAVDFEFRELPAMQMLKKYVTEGEMGTLRSARLEWIVGSWADPERPWSWQCDASLGGGILGSLGVHLFDAAEWLLGPMQRLRATTGIGIIERPHEVGTMKTVTSEDHVKIALQGSNGLPVQIALSNIEPAGTGLTLQIEGDAYTMILESATVGYAEKLRVRTVTRGTSRTLLEPDIVPSVGDARIGIFQSFATRLVRAVHAHDTTFRPSFIEGLRTDMLYEATMQSAKTKEWVDIAELSK